MTFEGISYSENYIWVQGVDQVSRKLLYKKQTTIRADQKQKSSFGSLCYPAAL